MEHLFTKNEPRKKWQYTGRDKEGSGKWEERKLSYAAWRTSQTLDISWRKSRAYGCLFHLSLTSPETSEPGLQAH